jgi:hypothetical protein
VKIAPKIAKTIINEAINIVVYMVTLPKKSICNPRKKRIIPKMTQFSSNTLHILEI